MLRGNCLQRAHRPMKWRKAWVCRCQCCIAGCQQLPECSRYEMAVLNRRSLQLLLNQSTAYLESQQINSFVGRLKNPLETFSAEWELITLAALACMGHVEHEPLPRDKSKLDVRFDSTKWPSFVADVVAVSDREYHRNNRHDVLASKLSQYRSDLAKEGIIGSFHYRIEGNRAAPWMKRYKTTLYLPAEHEFKKFVFNTNEFRKFIEEIHKDPTIPQHCIIQNEKAVLSIVFQPKGIGSSAIQPVYNSAHDFKYNVVYDALKDKADQIKRWGSQEPSLLRGIILCDGGCGILRGLHTVWEVSLQQIVEHFLRRSQSIHFVACVDIYPPFSYSLSNSFRLAFDLRLWAKKDVGEPAALQELFETAYKHIPAPKRTGVNAACNVQWMQQQPKFFGAEYIRGYRMSSSKITISARATMDFIAGRITREEFQRIVGESAKRLKDLLDDGFMVRDLAITYIEHEDDDELTLCLDKPDAAASDYRNPVEKQNQ